MQVIYYVDYDSFSIGRKLKFPEFINKDYKDLTANDKKSILQQCAQDFYDEDQERMDGMPLKIYVHKPDVDDSSLFSGFVETETNVSYTATLTEED